MKLLDNLRDWLYLSNGMDSDDEPNPNIDNYSGRRDSLQQLLFQAANDRSSGYGHHSGTGDHHSGYGGHHSGYGGYGHSDGYGSHSGYGHEPCCPPVIDPLTLISLLGRDFYVKVTV